MTTTDSPKPCRKCGGTGYLPHFARVDAGRCWACGKVEAVDVPGDAEARAEFPKTLADVIAARHARRASRA